MIKNCEGEEESYVSLTGLNRVKIGRKNFNFENELTSYVSGDHIDLGLDGSKVFFQFIGKNESLLTLNGNIKRVVEDHGISNLYYLKINVWYFVHVQKNIEKPVFKFKVELI